MVKDSIAKICSDFTDVSVLTSAMIKKLSIR